MKKLEFIDLEVCDEAANWASGKTWQEVYTTCHRGDWLLCLFAKTNPDNLRELTLAKGHYANTVRHLMKDERSIAFVDAAIAFGEGKISKEDLDTAYAAAHSAAYAAYTAYAAAFSAAFSADASAYASASTYASASAFSADADAIKENQQKTADICRKYLPIGIWNIKN